MQKSQVTGHGVNSNVFQKMIRVGGDGMADISTKQLEQMEKELQESEENIRATQDFEKPEKLYKELLESVHKYHPSADLSLIEKAYRIADEAHRGQVRKSGEPYIIHPLCVAIILAELELDKETIVAGLLHDVVEDTVMTDEEITKEFGSEVALSSRWCDKVRTAYPTMQIKWKYRQRISVRCFLRWQRISVSF